MNKKLIEVIDALTRKYGTRIDELQNVRTVVQEEHWPDEDQEMLTAIYQEELDNG